MTGAASEQERTPRVRMTGTQRREQLIEVGRTLFAERGYEAASVEEIAGRANVSKPVVYEHFGGKEGLYAVIVDREMSTLLGMITSSLELNRSRIRVERVALALLTYIEERTDGFRILVRDSPASAEDGNSRLSSTRPWDASGTCSRGISPGAVWIRNSRRCMRRRWSAWCR